MKAAVLKDKKQFAIEEVATPEPGPGEVVVKVSYCAICGSDVDRFKTGRYPGLILGHELCGRIAEVGEGVEGWSAGDRVAVEPITQCNTCYWCLHGQGNLCPNLGGTGMVGIPGGYAEFAKARPVQLFRVPAGMDEKEATMAQSLAVALHVVHLGEIEVGDTVVVIGAGPIGLLVLACARLAGAGKVYVTEKAEGRKRAAARLGADAVIDPTEVACPEELKKLTGIGADVVFGAAGTPEGIKDAFASARDGGTVALVGSHWVAELSSDMVTRGLTVRGNKAYRRCDFGRAVDLIAGGKIDCQALITDARPLSDIQRAVEELREPTTQVKILIAP
ncbi:MAG: alcohol dehydrogenase catalytic domain-containing protein [Chloroflexi bacterium]|nr:alcohol dehydrogenase catalytic domain-containing protein [Chloroflexota bacterium]